MYVTKTKGYGVKRLNKMSQYDIFWGERYYLNQWGSGWQYKQGEGTNSVRM